MNEPVWSFVIIIQGKFHWTKIYRDFTTRLRKKYGMECHIDHEENFPNNEKLFSETAIPGPF